MQLLYSVYWLIPSRVQNRNVYNAQSFPKLKMSGRKKCMGGWGGGKKNESLVFFHFHSG